MNNKVFFYLIAVFLGLVAGLWKKDWVTGLLSAYLFFILAKTILLREAGDQTYKISLFWSWKTAFRKWPMTPYGKRIFVQILLNVVLFIPVGFLLGSKIRWKSIPFSAGMSVTIELLQFITHRGFFEFDDIIHNTFGALIGLVVWFFWMRIVRKRHSSDDEMNHE